MTFASCRRSINRKWLARALPLRKGHGIIEPERTCDALDLSIAAITEALSAGGFRVGVFRILAVTEQPPRDNTGIPRWLVIGFAAKLLIITLIVGAILWYANA